MNRVSTSAHPGLLFFHPPTAAHRRLPGGGALSLCLPRPHATRSIATSPMGSPPSPAFFACCMTRLLPDSPRRPSAARVLDLLLKLSQRTGMMRCYRPLATCFGRETFKVGHAEVDTCLWLTRKFSPATTFVGPLGGYEDSAIHSGPAGEVVCSGRPCCKGDNRRSSPFLCDQARSSQALPLASDSAYTRAVRNHRSSGPSFHRRINKRAPRSGSCFANSASWHHSLPSLRCPSPDVRPL